MDDETSLIGDSKLSELSILVCKFPKNLCYWENLLNHLLTKAQPISKSIDKDLLQLIRSTYQSLLWQFPFLENYHIEYGLLEYKLGNFEKFHEIFENALQCFNNRSLLIWVEYLRICNKLISNNKHLFQKYAFAESYIGLHFFAAEFWKMYLDEIKLRCATPQHYIRTLRKVIEIPMYEYAKFHDLWLQAIENIRDLSQFKYFAEDEDLWKKLKIDITLQGRKGPHLQAGKKALRKISKELFLVVHYEVMEIYELFESKIQKRYYISAEELIPRQELITWMKYFDYIKNKKIPDLIHIQFQRSVLPLAHYDMIWLQYARFLVDDLNDLTAAKNILLQGISFAHKRSKIISMLSGLFIRLGNISDLHQLYEDLLTAFSNDLSYCNDFEVFVDYVQYNLFLSSSSSKSRYSGTSDNIEFSESLKETIIKRIDVETDHNRQYVILNLVNQMYTRFPTPLAEEKIYQHIIEKRLDQYEANPKFWYSYCYLIWFDNNSSYSRRRKQIIYDIIPKAVKGGESVISELQKFLSNYLPDDLESFTKKYLPGIDTQKTYYS